MYVKVFRNFIWTIKYTWKESAPYQNTYPHHDIKGKKKDLIAGISNHKATSLNIFHTSYHNTLLQQSNQAKFIYLHAQYTLPGYEARFAGRIRSDIKTLSSTACMTRLRLDHWCDFSAQFQHRWSRKPSSRVLISFPGFPDSRVFGSWTFPGFENSVINPNIMKSGNLGSNPIDRLLIF
jgi:hypothetical protein